MQSCCACFKPNNANKNTTKRNISQRESAQTQNNAPQPMQSKRSAAYLQKDDEHEIDQQVIQVQSNCDQLRSYSLIGPKNNNLNGGDKNQQSLNLNLDQHMKQQELQNIKQMSYVDNFFNNGYVIADGGDLLEPGSKDQISGHHHHHHQQQQQQQAFDGKKNITLTVMYQDQQQNVSSVQDQQQQQQQPNVTVSKSFRMYCMLCNKRFLKVMLLDLKQGHADSDLINLFEVQSMFNSSKNHEVECPFCGKSCPLILQETLLVGSQSQIDYREMINESKMIGTILSMSQSESHPVDKTIEKGKQESQNTQEYRPVVILRKVQGLRCTYKKAQVLIIDEYNTLYDKQKRRIVSKNNDSFDEVEDDISNQANDETKNQKNMLRNSNVGSLNDASSKTRTTNQATTAATGSISLTKRISSQHKAYFPEQMHCASAAQSNEFNGNLMKSMISNKMNKNGHFIESKIMQKDPSIFTTKLRDQQLVYNMQSRLAPKQPHD